MFKMFFYLIMGLTFVYSCKEQNSKDIILKDFKTVSYLSKTESPFRSLDIGEIVSMGIMDTVLVVSEFSGEKVFKLFSIENGSLIQSSVNRGRGPNELDLSYNILELDEDNFVIFDRIRSEFIYLSLCDLLMGNEIFSQREKHNYSVFNSIIINDSLRVFTGPFDSYQYLLTNISTGNSTFYQEYPDLGTLKSIQTATKAHGYQGHFTAIFGKNRFAFLSSLVGFFEICEIKDNEVIPVFRKSYGVPDLYVVQNRTALTPDLPYYFNSLSSTNEYVFTIYSGRTIREHGEEEYYAGNNLLVFDWNGNPVKRFVLDSYIRTFALDKKNMRLYGYSMNSRTMEPEIVVYELPEI